MGDRTWGMLFVRSSDADTFESHLDFGPMEGIVNDPEATYTVLYVGEHTPIDCAMPEGLPFIYRHGAGIEYGHYERVYDGAAYSEREMGHQCQGFVVDWALRDTSMELIREHMRIRASVLAKLGLKELP